MEYLRRGSRSQGSVKLLCFVTHQGDKTIAGRGAGLEDHSENEGPRQLTFALRLQTCGISGLRENSVDVGNAILGRTNGAKCFPHSLQRDPTQSVPFSNRSAMMLPQGTSALQPDH